MSLTQDYAFVRMALADISSKHLRGGTLIGTPSEKQLESLDKQAMNIKA
jgi:hypothetical protein